MNQDWTPGQHPRHLNYNHLLYFWTVAREGSIAAAATVLHLTPQTIGERLSGTAGDALRRMAGDAAEEALDDGID